MRLYDSFLLRRWIIRGAGAEGERSVLDIEHIQTGERFRPASLAEAEGWMADTRRREGVPAEPDPAGAEAPGEGA